MSNHVLKTDPEAYDDVAAGLKPYELRFDDRGYEVGDHLVLKKTLHSSEEMKAGAPLLYVGQPIVRRVEHILRGPCYGLRDGWAILALEQTAQGNRIAELERQLAAQSEDARDAELFRQMREIYCEERGMAHEEYDVRLSMAIKSRQQENGK